LGYRTIPEDGITDTDLDASLLAAWRSPGGRYAGDLFVRVVSDIDGGGDPKTDPFRSVYDASDGTAAVLHHAFVDVAGARGVELVRLGRQYVHEGGTFHFDGIRVDSPRGPGGLRAMLFGGAPVRFFADSGEDSWIAGAGVEATPVEGLRLGLRYAWLRGRTSVYGHDLGEGTNELVVADLLLRRGSSNSLSVVHTSLDGSTRDVLATANARSEPRATSAFVSYRRQPAKLSEFSLDLPGFGLVQGERAPFERMDVALLKEVKLGGRGLVLSLGGSVRRLLGSAVAGEYNRDYDHVRAGVEFQWPGSAMPPGARRARRSHVSLGWSRWSTAGDEVTAADFEIRKVLSERSDVRLGTSYSLYTYDAFTLDERTDVRELYLKTRIDLGDGHEVRFGYSYEDSDDEIRHELRLRWRVAF
jgi:hypothetical protein